MMTDVNDVREARQPRNQGFSLPCHIGADSGLCLVAGTFSEQAAASCSACPAGLLLLMHRTCLDCISHEGLPPSRPESGQPAWVLMSLSLSPLLCMSLGGVSRRRMRLTARPNAWQESTSIARVQLQRQTAKAARRIQTLHRAVSLACATQDTRGLMAGHAKLAAPGRTRTRLAPAHALHASPVSIARG